MTMRHRRFAHYRKPGVSALGSGVEPRGDAAVLFHEAVEAKQQLGMSKAEAVRAVVKANPELQAAYVRSHNARVEPPTYGGSTLD